MIVLAFWASLYANHNLEFSMFGRFMSRLIAYGAVLLAFGGWWLSRSAVSWRDRLAAIVIAVFIAVASTFLVDRSINGFGYFLSAFPWVVTAWVAWLVAARSWSPRTQRAGFCFVMLSVFGYFTLVRFDGVDAAQRAEMSWRWQPTSEKQFLAAKVSSAKTTSNVAGQPPKPWKLQPHDCPEYRGRKRDGVVTGVKLATDWMIHPPKLLWRQAAGPGWSGLIVVDGHLVTQEQRGEMEVVVCCDAATGEELWVHQDRVRFEEALAGAGPRATPMFADGRIYSLGAKGMLNCLTAETGQRVWAREIVTDAHLKPADIPVWGYSVSPLVVDGLVIVHAGGPRGMLAYRAENGEPAWAVPAGKQSYSSPQLAELHGLKQVLMHDSHALSAYNIADGALLWERPAATETLPMLQPHQADSSSILISTEPGAALIGSKREGDKWTVLDRWTSNRFRPAFNDFVVHKEHMYGLDDGVLCCIDLATGERVWKKGRFGHGQVLMLADQDALLVSSDKGEIILIAVTPTGHEELGRVQAIEGKTWNSPVLVGNRVFLRNGKEIAAYELSLATDSTSAVADRSPDSSGPVAKTGQ
jgi:outer membrane protein assembly factor BamB